MRVARFLPIWMRRRRRRMLRSGIAWPPSPIGGLVVVTSAHDGRASISAAHAGVATIDAALAGRLRVIRRAPL